MTSTSDELKLSVGLSGAVDLINHINVNKFAQLSQRILAAVPVKDAHTIFTKEEKEKLVPVLGVGSTTNVTLVVTALLEIWNCIVLKQMKPEILKESLVKLGFSEGLADTFLDVWMKVGATVSNRLKDVSCSETPELLDVNWTLRMDIAKKNSPKLNQPAVVLELVTSDGVKYTKMSRSELRELFNTLQEIQSNLDNLLY